MIRRHGVRLISRLRIRTSLATIFVHSRCHGRRSYFRAREPQKSGGADRMVSTRSRLVRRASLGGDGLAACRRHVRGGGKGKNKKEETHMRRLWITDGTRGHEDHVGHAPPIMLKGEGGERRGRYASC